MSGSFDSIATTPPDATKAIPNTASTKAIVHDTLAILEQGYVLLH